ncbi:MAG: hypothetical protein AB8F26_05285 [Phycisphaerales bacterium]
MSDEANKSGPHHSEPDPECQGGKLDGAMSVGALIRAAADGELTDAQVESFEQLCAERDCTNDRVRFEQTLREACGKAMADQPKCPDILRAKIQAMAATGGDAGQPFGAAIRSETGSESAVEAMAEQTRSVSFWRRSPGMLAAAAVLFIAAGVLILQSASLPSGPVPAGWTAQQVSDKDRIANFVAKEHNRCCHSDRASEAKLVIRDIEEARTYFASALGVANIGVSAEQAESGEVNFWGGGDCHVPASDSSGHLRFDAVSPDGGDLRLSLFVVNDQGQMPMEEGVTYRVSSESCDKAGVRLFTWKQAGVVYLLVSEAEGAFCGTVRQTLHAPDDVRSL